MTQSKSLDLWVAGSVVVIGTVLCFLPALRNTLYVWDNEGYILYNDNIRTLSFATVSWAFTEFWCNYWAPLTWLSLAVDYAVWGLNPIGYHLTNIVLHAANAGLFFLLAHELLLAHFACDESPEKAIVPRGPLALWVPLLAALVFAIHPLRVESVAWAAERKDVLSLLFGIPAMLAYLRYAASPQGIAVSRNGRLGSFAGSAWYWASFTSFCLSLLAKPMLVTLPAVLLLLDALPLGRARRANVLRLVLEKLPFWIAAAAVALIAARAQTPQTMSYSEAGLISRILVAVKSIGTYLWLTLWPVDISPFYVHPKNIAHVDGSTFWSALAIAAVTAAAVWTRKRPVFLVSWLVFLVALLPVLGLFVQVGPQAMAARFTYFPSLAVALVTALAIVVAIARTRARWLSIVLTCLTGAWLAGLFYCTTVHIGFWKDDVTLWTRVIDLAPRQTGRAYFQRGVGYLRIGQPTRALADLNEAIEVAMSKGYPGVEIYRERARAFVALGRLRDAIADHSSALVLAGPGDRSTILLHRGELHLRLGEAELAAKDFEMASATP
jgi:hypothetical protein